MGAVSTRTEAAPLAATRRPPGGKRAWAAFRRFLRSCQHSLLYPPGHPDFGTALQRAVDGCQELLAVLPACTLELDPAGPSLMGQPCPADSSLDRFAARLQEREITVITFLEGATKQELLAFIELLRAEPEIIAEQGGAEAWLSRAGVQRITLAPPQLALSVPAEWGSFLAAQDAADRAALEALLALCPETCPWASPRASRCAQPAGTDEEAMLLWLVEALCATAAACPAARPGEPPAASPSRTDWLRSVARAVGQLTPPLRGRLFRVAAPSGGDMLGEVASLLTPEEAAEILVCHPNAVVGEPSDQLEAVLRRLMPDPERARQVEPLAKARLLSRGMTEKSYQNVVSLVLRRNSLAADLLDQEQRGEGVRRLSLPTDLLSSASPWSVQENLVDTLLELVASPGECHGREQLTQRLAQMLPAALGARDDGRAAELLRRVEETIGSGALSPAEKRLLRAHLAQACSPELCRRLARFMVQAPSQENVVILWLVSQAEEGFDVLLQTARGTTLFWLQGAVGSAIVRMGERSLEGCYHTLSAGAPEAAVALIRALVLSGTREGLERSWWAQEHPDPAVHVGLMEALAYSSDVTAERVLLDALHRGCPEVQSAAARSLGRHPSDQVVAELSALLANPSSLRRMEVTRSVCEALAQIGRSECLPVLKAMLGRKHLLLRGQARELRALAAQTLAALPDPEAEQILREGANGKSSELSALCAEALERRRLALPREVSRGGC